VICIQKSILGGIFSNPGGICEEEDSDAASCCRINDGKSRTSDQYTPDIKISSWNKLGINEPHDIQETMNITGRDIIREARLAARRAVGRVKVQEQGGTFVALTGERRQQITAKAYDHCQPSAPQPGQRTSESTGGH